MRRAVVVLLVLSLLVVVAACATRPKRAATEPGTSSLATTPAAVATATTPATVTPTADTATPPPAREPEEATEQRPEEPGNRFCFLDKVESADGVWWITVDYVDFLFGKEAAQAAKAAGDESPPPNDYYIRNVNPKLRKLRVGDGVKAVLLNGGPTDKERVEMKRFAAMGPRLKERKTLLRITVSDGIVTSLEQEYRP